MPLAAAVTGCWFCGMRFQVRVQGGEWERMTGGANGLVGREKEFFYLVSGGMGALALGAGYGVAPLRPDFGAAKIRGVRSAGGISVGRRLYQE